VAISQSNAFNKQYGLQKKLSINTFLIFDIIFKVNEVSEYFGNFVKLSFSSHFPYFFTCFIM